MPAYLIAISKVKDQAKLQEYATKAGPTLGAHGAKVIARGGISEALVGVAAGDIALVAEFPDAAAIRTWYSSADYQAAIPTREKAMDANFLIIEPPPA
jgi:uncharacterized protein (DUF1330 family)